MARVGRDDWADAAVAAIAQGGLAAVAVEPLARRLGVTKGSFYWHFASRDELVGAAIDRWEDVHSTLPELPTDPRAALDALAELAVDFAVAPSVHARLVLEAEDPRVAAAIARVTDLRLSGLAERYRALGLTPARARAHAKVSYAAVLGLQRLQAEGALGPRDAPGVKRRLREIFAVSADRP